MRNRDIVESAELCASCIPLASLPAAETAKFERITDKSFVVGTGK